MVEETTHLETKRRVIDGWIKKLLFSFIVPLLVASGVAYWQVHRQESAAYENGIKALQMESAFIQSWVKNLPNASKKEFILAPFTMEMAKGFLGSRIFYFADPGLAFLLTNYIAAGDILLNRIDVANRKRQNADLTTSKGLFLDILYLLQKEFHRELRLRNSEMRGTERSTQIRDAVRSIKNHHLPTDSDSQEHKE